MRGIYRRRPNTPKPQKPKKPQDPKNPIDYRPTSNFSSSPNRISKKPQNLPSSDTLLGTLVPDFGDPLDLAPGSWVKKLIFGILGGVKSDP